MQDNRQNKIEKVAESRQEGIVVLEDVHDPHNAAAILRSCDAFGWQKVFFVFDKEEGYDPKSVGSASSSSANKWLDFEIFKSVEECYGRLKKDGFEIAATVLDDEAKAIGGADLKARKLALVLGNEHRGLSTEAIGGADQKIYIPMKGMVQSLNVSVTAAIMLYEIDRQRTAAGREKYYLSLQEKEKLVVSLARR